MNKIKIDDFEISNLSGHEIGKKLEKAQTKIIIELQKLVKGPIYEQKKMRHTQWY